MRQLFVAMQSGAESPRAILQVEEFLRQEVTRLVRAGTWPNATLYRIGDS
jgi:hypothetical protein